MLANPLQNIDLEVGFGVGITSKLLNCYVLFLPYLPCCMCSFSDILLKIFHLPLTFLWVMYLFFLVTSTLKTFKADKRIPGP